MKPYAFIQYESDSYDGVDRVSRLIIKHGLDPEDFYFSEFDYLPNWLEDSFSTGFAEGAARLGERIKVTVARRITDEMETEEERAPERRRQKDHGASSFVPKMS